VSNDLPVAFVGAGAHATSSLYPHLHKVPDLDLVAVCDLDRAKAEHHARWFGARKVYTDLAEMLAKEELAGVYICGDPKMMHAVGLQVLAKGIPIFVEKPPAMDVPLARELAQAAEDHGAWGMVAFMKRFAPCYVETREVLQSEEFGGLQLFEIRFNQGPYPELWGITDTRLAMLTGQLCHIFDLTRYLGGDVAWVQANQRYLSPDRFGLLVSCGFTSGAIGTMNLNTLEGAVEDPWGDIGEFVRCTGVGDAITVEEMIYYQRHRPLHRECTQRPHTLAHQYEVIEPSWIFSNYGDLAGYTGELAYFAQCVREGHPPVQGATLWDGAKSLELTEAIYASLQREGARVEIPVR
jgi:myo-inositol 2-dehydrogenase/D-chiro-inositol 1-dehydrogenase